MRRLSVLVLLALVTAPASADFFGSVSNAINSATNTVSNGLNTATNAVSSGVGTAVNATSNGLDVAANATKQVGCTLSPLLSGHSAQLTRPHLSHASSFAHITY